VLDADHVRLGRIAGKLAAARAMPVPPKAFGVEGHAFKLGAPLPEAVVTEFEERHEVALPPAYRLFVTGLGDGGAGPGYHLSSLSTSCRPGCLPGHLARPSPYLPGPRYRGDWEQRYEDPPGPDRMFLRGTLQISDHGCTLATRLVVTGPARGRLLNLDCDGPAGPYVVEDADFLAWYERWLDEAVAGYGVGWFGERLPLEKPGLIATLAGDPSPARRARAGESLLQLPAISDSIWSVLSDAMAADADAFVRATLWDLLKWDRYRHQRRLDDAEAIAGEIARHARACTPLDLEALGILRRLTVADVLAELAEHDLERRRRAAYQLAWSFSGITKTALEGLPDDPADRLLSDADPLLRSHGIAAVRRFRVARLHPRLRELQKTETDPWVQYWLSWCLAERPTRDDPWSPAAPGYADEPPF
jgi:hypothetical protein